MKNGEPIKSNDLYTIENTEMEPDEEMMTLESLQSELVYQLLL